MAEDKGFLGRWSARKVAVKEGKPVAEPAPSVIPAQAGIHATPSNRMDSRLRGNDGEVQVAPALTLDDVSVLTPASDFSAFIAKGVSPLVKNAAMKKLFTDPHYNIMDGLDIYIGDYNTHDVLPQSVIDEMTKDGFLNMFQKDVPIKETATETLAISPTAKAPFDDHPDLQLQRDDAAGRESTIDSAINTPEVPAGAEAPQPAVPSPST